MADDSRVSTWTTIQDGLFGLGAVMAKDVPNTTWFYAFQLLINWAQLMSFPLLAVSGTPWTRTPVEMFSNVFSFANPARIVQRAAGVSTFLFLVCAIAWVAAFVMMSAFVARRFVLQLPQNEILLRILRIVALLSTTALFLPFSEIIFRGLACSGPTWLETSWRCDDVNRVLVACVLALLLVAFAALSLFSAAVFIDRDPASESWNAKAHGRVHIVELGIKILLAFLFNSVRSELVGSPAMTAVLIGCGVLWMYMMWRKAPFAHVHINCLEFGFAASFCWASVVLGIAQVAPRSDYWLLVVFGVPLVVLAAYKTAQVHFTHIANKPLEECDTVEEMMTWAHAKMQLYRKLSRGKDRNAPPTSDEEADPMESSLDSPFPAPTHHQRDSVEYSAPSFNRTHLQSSSSDAPTLVSGTVHSLARTLTMVTGQAPPSQSNPRQVHPATASARVTRSRPMVSSRRQRAAAFRKAEKAYKLLGERFPENELALVLASSFHAFHSSHRIEEATYLARLLRCSPSIDSRFVIRSRIQQMQSGVENMSSIDRILNEQSIRRVRNLRIEAARILTTLWDALRQKEPDLDVVLDAASRLGRANEQIDELYRGLMEKSIAVTPEILRGYAGFLLDQQRTTNKAQELLNKADRIENASSRVRTAPLRHFVFGLSQSQPVSIDASVAVVTVSCFESSMGEVVGINIPAVRMFGYSSKSQIVGQNIGMLMPPPIRQVHNQLMSGLQGKRLSHIVNKSRLFLGSRQDGSVFPLWMNVTEAPPDPRTCEPRLSASLTDMPCSEEILVFGGIEDGFPLLAASKKAMEMLGVNGDTIESDTPSLLPWFPSLAPTFQSREVRLMPDQLEQLRGANAHGKISKELTRVIAATPRNSSAGRDSIISDKNVTVLPLLSNTNGAGLIPVVDALNVFAGGDDDSIGDADSLRSGFGAFSPKAYNSRNSHSSREYLQRKFLVFGEVQLVQVPGARPFHVLCYRRLSGPAPRMSQRTEAARTDGRNIPPILEERGSSSHSGSDLSSPKFPIIHTDLNPASKSTGNPASLSSSSGEADFPRNFQQSHSLNCPGPYDRTARDFGSDSSSASASVSSSPIVRQEPPSLSPSLFGGSLLTTNPRSSSAKVAPSPQDQLLPPIRVRDASVSEDGSRRSSRVADPHAPVTSSNSGAAGALTPPSTHTPPVTSVRWTTGHQDDGSKHTLIGMTAIDGDGGGSFLEMATSRNRRASTVDGSLLSGGMSHASSGASQLASVITLIGSRREPEVRFVRIVFITLVVWALAMVIATAVWVESSWNQLLDLNDAVRIAGQRSVALAGASTALQGLVALNEGVAQRNLPFSIDDYALQLQDAAQEFADTNRELFLLGNRGGLTGNAFESEPSVSVSAGRFGLVQKQSVVEISNVLESDLIRMGSKWENVTANDPEVDKVFSWVAPLLGQMELGLYHRHADLEQLAVELETTAFVASAVVFVLTVVTTTAFVASVTLRLQSRIMDTLSVFLHIPQTVAMALWRQQTVRMNKEVMDANDAGGVGEGSDVDSALGDDEVHGLEPMDGAENDDKTGIGNGREDLPVDDDEALRQNQLMEEENAEEALSAAIRRHNRRLVRSLSSGGDPNSEERTARKNGSYVCRRLLLLALPMLAIFVVLAGTAGWQLSEAKKLLEQSHRVVMLGRSAERLSSTQMSLSMGLFTNNVSARIPLLQLAESRLADITPAASVAIFGGAVTEEDHTTATIPPLNDPKSKAYILMTENACIRGVYHNSIEQTTCQTFDNGLLTNGAFASLNTISSAMSRTIQSALDGSAYSPNSSISDPIPDLTASTIQDLHLFSHAVEPFTRRALVFASDSIAEDIARDVDSTMEGTSALSWTFAVCFSITTLAFYLPYASKLAQPLHSAQNLLLLLPSEVVQRIPSVHEKLRDIVSNIQISTTS